MSSTAAWLTRIAWALCVIFMAAIAATVYFVPPQEAPALALAIISPMPTARPASPTPTATPIATDTSTPTPSSTPTASSTPSSTPTPQSKEPQAALSTLSDTATATLAPSVRLIFVGDVMLGRNITPVRRAQGNGYPLALVAPILRSADLTFANLESPLTNLPHYPGGYNLQAEPAAVESLSLAGFDWVSVANNHSGDHGRGGMIDTIKALRSKNILWAGGGEDEASARRPALVTVNGLRLALLAYDGTYATIEAVGNLAGSQKLDLNRAIADVKRARTSVEIVIVSIHWGVEYSAQPTTSEKQIARQLVDAGAALVIGHHPHVVEPMEWIARADGRTSVVAYSLGNFLFDMCCRIETMESPIMQVIVDKQGVAALNLIPTRKVGNQIRVQSAANGAGLISRLLPRGAMPAAWQTNTFVDADGRTWWRRPSP